MTFAPFALLFALLFPILAHSQMAPSYIPRSLAGKLDGEVAAFNAAQDGAKCDGTTDDSAAINATLARIRAVSQMSGNAWAIGHTGSLVLPKGQCLIKSTLNATGLYGGGFTWNGSGTQILCQTNGTPCIDGTGTGQANFRDLNIYGSATLTPNIGLMLSRLTTSLSQGADHNKLDYPTIVGWFTLAPYYARSTETTIVHGANFNNYQPSAYAAIWDGSNAFHIQSALSGTTYTNDTFSSNNENSCIDCIFEVFGSGSVPLWIGGTSRHKFYNSYALSNGGGSMPAVILSFKNSVVNDFLMLDLHVENTTLSSYLWVTGAANPVINGLSIEDHNPFQSGPLFARDTSTVTSVTLRGANLKIGLLGGTSPSWWDLASAWTVGGSVFSQDSTYTAPGTFSGTTCSGSTCSANLTFNALTATTVSATTVSGSTINSGTISNPGAISAVSVATPVGGNASYWSSQSLAGALPGWTFPASDGNGGGGTAALTQIVLYGTPTLSGGVGCSANDTFNLIDPQTGGNLVGGGTLIMTATTVSSGAVTASGISATSGNAYLWAKPLSSSTALTARTSTCTTLPTVATTSGYPTANWSYSNGAGSLKATISLTAGGSGYTAQPNQTPTVAYLGTSTGAALSVTLSSSMKVSAGNGSVSMGSSGTSLGIAGSGGYPVLSLGALIDNSGIRQALTSSYTVPANTSLVRFTQASTLAASTVTLPTAVADGQPIQFVNYAGAITALTFSPTVNGWTNAATLAAYSSIRVRWDATAAAWFREQ